MSAPASANNPLKTLKRPPPEFSEDFACELAHRHYGLDAIARPLLSERDQNFRLKTPDGRRFVLKIANVDEDPRFTDFQVAALRHIETKGDIGVAVPRVILSRDGREQLAIDGDAGTHRVRLVSYVPGEPMPRCRTPALAESIGTALARLGRALADFEHPGSGQVLLWDMQHALELVDLLDSVPDDRLRALSRECLEDFRAYALPAFGELRQQVIHNDMNPANVLTLPADRERVTGVIDFGDMQRLPLIVDVGVAASYLRPAEGDPLELVAHMVRAYHDEVPLTEAETRLLYDLVATRLATTVILLQWRRGDRGAEDEYLVDAAESEEDAADFLKRWRDCGRETAAARFRAACR